VSLPPPAYPRGPRVSLREFEPEDNAAWQRVVGDPLVAPHAPWPVLTTVDDASAWIAESRRRATVPPRRSFYLAVEQYGTDLIGGGTLDVVSLPHRQGEIACYLRTDRWGEGLGTEIARLLLELAFTRLELHRVQAAVDPDNVAARRVLEHANMRHEGTLLDRYFVVGQWRDRAVYAITMPEWRGQPRRGGGGASAVTDAQGAPSDPGAADHAAPVPPPAEAIEPTTVTMAAEVEPTDVVEPTTVTMSAELDAEVPTAQGPGGD
jgi:[ribosomal protein S5]-alanine N-acetyltransferase